MKSHINSCPGRTVGEIAVGLLNRTGVHVGHYFLQLKRVTETAQTKLREEGLNAGHSMPKIRRHTGFAIADEAVVAYANLHPRSGVAGTSGDAEGMLQLQLVGLPFKAQARTGHAPVGARLPGLGRGQAVGLGTGGLRLLPEVLQAAGGHRRSCRHHDGVFQKLTPFHFFAFLP